MARVKSAGGSVASIRHTVTVHAPGRCKVRIRSVHLGSVPMDDAFVREKAEVYRRAAESNRSAGDRMRRSHRTSAAEAYARQADLCATLAAVLGGESLALRGSLGEGLGFEVTGLRLRQNAIDLDVRPSAITAGTNP